MLEYTKTEPPMEIRTAGGNVLLSTAQDILLVVVRDTDDILRTVKLPIVRVLLKRGIYFPVRPQLKKALKIHRKKWLIS